MKILETINSSIAYAKDKVIELNHIRVENKRSLQRGTVLDPFNHPSYTKEQVEQFAKTDASYKASLARLEKKYGY